MTKFLKLVMTGTIVLGASSAMALDDELGIQGESPGSIGTECYVYNADKSLVIGVVLDAYNENILDEDENIIGNTAVMKCALPKPKKKPRHDKPTTTEDQVPYIGDGIEMCISPKMITEKIDEVKDDEGNIITEEVDAILEDYASTTVWKNLVSASGEVSLVCKHLQTASENQPPVANAGADQDNAVICTTVTLDGTGSLDPDGDTLTYQWTMKTKPAGSGAALSSTTDEKPTFDADKEGDYTIELVVNDGEVNSAVSTVRVTAGNKTGRCVSHNNTNDYCEVVSPYTCKIWLDKNLGAARVCTNFDDTACYGDYYQWGRNFDGHQDSGSGTTPTLATNVNDVGHGNYITTDIPLFDWTSIDGDGSTRSANWSNTGGSSVCPAGFRVPTINELRAELLDAGSAEIQNRDDAFNSFLMLPSNGYRDRYSGAMVDIGSWGGLWSSSVDGSYSPALYFSIDGAIWANRNRSMAKAVRCLRD